MEVGELMAFKPVTAPKRPAQKDSESGDYEEGDASYEMRAAKRRKAKQAKIAAVAAQKRLEQERMAMLESELEQSNGVGNHNEEDSSLTSEQRAAIQQHIEYGGDVNAEALDETKLKRLVLAFEKRATKNQELRIKFSDEPTKFLNSEVELHDTIQDLRTLATAPDLYPTFVDLQCVPSLLGLLSHENTDISIAVVDLIQELTDIDTLNESEDGTSALIQALTTNQISALLVQNLDRLNENSKEESDGIHNTLSIVENLIEFKPEICKEVADAGLLVWLTKKLKVKMPFDNNKLYASEILSILLQNEPENRKVFSDIAGSPLDSMLQQLAYYKRHNPGNAEEQEMMENLFDCLCSLLLHSPNRDKFLKAEGLQLMNLMLREKKVSRSGALKVLNHALIGVEGKDNCTKFVDILGLRTIFPLFMKTPKKSQRKGVSAEEHEEHAISVIASLLKNCRGSQRQRLLAKFTENDHEKVDRLMELHFKYLERVEFAEHKIAKEGLDKIEDEEEIYLRRLSGGLFSLQLIDYIIVDSCSSGSSSIKQRVLKILNQRNASIKTIRNIIREYAGNVGESKDTDADGNEENMNKEDDEIATEQERTHLLHLVDKF